MLRRLACALPLAVACNAGKASLDEDEEGSVEVGETKSDTDRDADADTDGDCLPYGVFGPGHAAARLGATRAPRLHGRQGDGVV